MSAIFGLVGVILGIASNFGIEWYRNNQRARSIAGMVAAEIAVQIEQADERAYIELFTQIASKLRASGTASYPNFFSNGPEVNPLYDLIKSDIGILGPEYSYLVSKYYLNANSIRFDVVRLSSMNLERSAHLGIIEGNIRFWQTTRENGLKLSKDLREASAKPLFRQLKRHSNSI